MLMKILLAALFVSVLSYNGPTVFNINHAPRVRLGPLPLHHALPPGEMPLIAQIWNNRWGNDPQGPQWITPYWSMDGAEANNREMRKQQFDIMRQKMEEIFT